MSKKLKILFLVPRFPFGTETFILNQIVDLIDKGHLVHIFATDRTYKKVHPKIVEYKLLENTFFPNYPTSFLKRLIAFSKSFSQLNFKNKLRLLKSLNIKKYGVKALKLTSFFNVYWLTKAREDYDIVHAHFGQMSDFYFLAQECGFLKNSKLITTFHGYDILPTEREKNIMRYQKLLKNNIILSANTQYTKNLLLQIGVNSQNIHVLPVGLDTNYFHKKINKNSEIINIIFCGRIIKCKGVSQIVEIANILINELNYENIRFNIIGESGESDRKELKTTLHKIKLYNLEKYFNLLGLQTQEEVINYMANADIFILPGVTTSEGRADTQGLVIQEAQALKTPVIVSNAGGMKYGLIDNETGFIVDENDIKGYTKKIEFLINNPKHRKLMGENARDFVKKNYDSKILGDQLEKIYFNQLK